MRFAFMPPSTLTGNIQKHPAFPSRILGNRRDVLVYLPAGYRRFSTRQYPVLYLHDGQNVFDAATAFGTRLMPTMPPELRVTAPEFAHDVWIETGTFDYPMDYCRHAFIDRDVKTVQDACRALFAKVDPTMHPSLLDEVVAAAMQKKMVGNTSAQAQTWTRLRNARWIYAVWRQLPTGAEADEAAQVQAIRANGELAYVKSLVAAAHMPIEAPASFVTKEPTPWKRRALADSASKAKDSGQ